MYMLTFELEGHTSWQRFTKPADMHPFGFRYHKTWNKKKNLSEVSTQIMKLQNTVLEKECIQKMA